MTRGGGLVRVQAQEPPHLGDVLPRPGEVWIFLGSLKEFRIKGYSLCQILYYRVSFLL